MRSKYPYSVVITFALLGLFAACEKDSLVTPTSPTSTVNVPKPPRAPAAPTARAGNDTTLMLPFSTFNLNGSASTDQDSNINSYSWRQYIGPALAEITNYKGVRAFASNLSKVGTYGFVLTVIDADTLSSTDTVKVTVATPSCTGPNQEVVLKNLKWGFPMMMELEIGNPYAHVPQGSHIKNFFIKRDTTNKWEPVMVYDYNSPQYGLSHMWIYGNKTLVIVPGNNLQEDTPDVKIEYCQ